MAKTRSILIFALLVVICCCVEGTSGEEKTKLETFDPLSISINQSLDLEIYSFDFKAFTLLRQNEFLDYLIWSVNSVDRT